MPRSRSSKKAPPKPNKAVRSYVRKAIKASKPSDKYNVSSTGTTISTTFVATGLTGISQGDGLRQRVGDLVKPTFMRFKYYLNNTTTNIQLSRIVILQWRPDSAVETPTASAIFQNQTDTQSDFVYDKQARAKFRVLSDTWHGTKPVAVNAVVPTRELRISLKSAGTIKYADTATTGKNHIYLVTLGSQATGIAFAYYSTVGFKELV